jgi:hypothetical protein
MSSTATSLAGQAEELRTAVAFFRVDGADVRPAAPAAARRLPRVA